MAIHFVTHDRLIVAHAILACIVVLGLIPMSLFVARYKRHEKWWCDRHRLVNTISILLIIVVFALGTGAVKVGAGQYQYIGPLRDFHHDFGLAVSVLFLFQGCTGAAGTWLPSRYTEYLILGRTAIRWFHMVVGIVITGFAITECWSGFGEWNEMQSTGTFTPDAVRYVFVLVIGIESAVYVYPMGLAVLHRIADGSSRGMWQLKEDSPQQAE